MKNTYFVKSSLKLEPKSYDRRDGQKSSREMEKLKIKD
jgi:hypothetical protein